MTVLALLVSCLAVQAGPSARTAVAAACPALDVVFARGSGELAGLGTAGRPLVRDIAARLPGVDVGSYAVPYGASLSQTTAGPGATAMTAHVVERAAACPSTRFVVGGYSQGASVTDIAIGIPTTLGTGRRIPTELAPRIVAVIAFGNPLGLSGRTIAGSSPLYGSRSWEACNPGDTVCGPRVQHPGGFGHLSYPFDGSTGRAATFVATMFGRRA